MDNDGIEVSNFLDRMRRGNQHTGGKSNNVTDATTGLGHENLTKPDLGAASENLKKPEIGAGFTVLLRRNIAKTPATIERCHYLAIHLLMYLADHLSIS